jgi:hypothetical protein
MLTNSLVVKWAKVSVRRACHAMRSDVIFGERVAWRGMKGSWQNKGSWIKSQIWCNHKFYCWSGFDSDRNWLEFLSVLDATFSYYTPSDTPPEDVKAECSKHIATTQDLFTRLAEEDGQKDRSALLALLELENRARSHGLSNGWSFFLIRMKLSNWAVIARSGTEDCSDKAVFSSSRW